MRRLTFVALLTALAVGCTGKQEGESRTELMPVNERFEVVPGLGAKILRRGYGRRAEPGDIVDVHYTGWLQNPAVETNRGRKFDSSLDRGERFRFTIGAGQVIRGWDKGVAGMLVGEVRELTIAPDLAYGPRGYGNVIPPNSTLIFEIQLFGVEPPPATDQ